MSGTDPQLSRLKASDPAAHATVDDQGLRAVLVADLSATSRRRRRLTGGAFTATAALALAAGVLVGGAGHGAAPSEVPALAGGAPQAPGDSATSATPEPMRGGAEATDMAWAGAASRVVFSARGLSDEPGAAHAWGFSGHADPQAVAGELADALGLAGEPTLRDGAWTIGDWATPGPVLQVYTDPWTSFSFWDPTAEPTGCAVTTLPAPAVEANGAPDAQSGGGSTGSPEPAPCEPVDLGPAPSTQEAIDTVTAALGSAGLGGTVRFAPTSAGDQVVYLTGYVDVAGMPSDIMVSASVTAEGISSLSGSAPAAVDLGEYPVISPAAAVERLTDPRFGATRSWDQWGIAAVDVAQEPASSAPTPSTPAPGDSLPWAVSTVVITSAELTLATYTADAGTTFLAPTYLLTGEDGSRWTVIAVADSHLDTTTA